MQPHRMYFNCYYYLPITVTEYLKGDKWKVHPDWVYCEYNSPHDLERERENSGELFSRDHQEETMFDTPENQLLHFLARAGRPGWKWMSVSHKESCIVARSFRIDPRISRNASSLLPPAPLAFPTVTPWSRSWQRCRR